MPMHALFLGESSLTISLNIHSLWCSMGQFLRMIQGLNREVALWSRGNRTPRTDGASITTISRPTLAPYTSNLQLHYKTQTTHSATARFKKVLISRVYGLRCSHCSIALYLFYIRQYLLRYLTIYNHDYHTSRPRSKNSSPTRKRSTLPWRQTRITIPLPRRLPFTSHSKKPVKMPLS